MFLTVDLPDPFAPVRSEVIPRGSIDLDNAETFLQVPGLVLAALVAVTMGAIALVTDWNEATRGPFSETAEAIGEALLDKYVLPFELASVLLLAAMVGAIVLVRED